MKFEEGKYYNFQVLKEVDLPEEGRFFLLRHISGRRLMLPVESYNGYNISPDMTIKCRIDKVSCTGKVYLEPVHPVYKEGKIYSFQLVSIDYQNNIAFIRDVLGNIISQEIEPNSIINSSNVDFRVVRIKKGIPQLAIPNKTIDFKGLKKLIGINKPFKVKDIKKDNENDDLFIFESREGYLANLKVKNYIHYKIKVGEVINCYIYGYLSNGLLKIEPENPYYKEGEEYDFEIVGSESVSNDLNSNEEVLLVMDYFGNKCGVTVSLSNFYPSQNEKTRINCRVIGFRKGRPKLELVK